MTLCAAFDLGTSGARAAAVDRTGRVVARAAIPAPDARAPDGTVDPEDWWLRARRCLEALGAALDREGRSMAEIAGLTGCGTSGSMVLTDAEGRPVSRGLLYDSAHAQEAAELAARAPTVPSALPRMLRLARSAGPGARHLAHQVDLVLWRLGARIGTTDANDALKTGHDPEAGWPGWLAADPELGPLLPQVHPFGEPLGAASEAARALGLRRGCAIRAGTTDSVAAFLAAGVRDPGQAVTSLGSTTALKVVSGARVDDPARGVYSHRLGDLWLAGGASNAGGAALAAALPGADLAALSARIDPEAPSGLDYHPLVRPGERFPVVDPALAPRLTPRPADDARFLHGMLEGIARIERDGYRALAERGAPYPSRVLTAGGGAANDVWRAIRARLLGVPVERMAEAEAAVGLARAIHG